MISKPAAPRKQEVTRTVYLSAPDAIERPHSSTPRQAQKVTWAGPITQLFGETLESIPNTEQWWLDRIHADDVDITLKTLSEHLQPAPDNPFAAPARICGLEYRFRHRDGHYILCSERYYTTRDGDGIATRTDSAIFDKDLRRRERALHAATLDSQTQLAIVAQNTPSGIFMMDPNGYTSFMNAAAEEITGFKFEEIHDHLFHAAVHSCRPNGDPYPVQECPVFCTQQAGTAAKNQDEVFVHKDGRFYDIVYSVSPVGDYSTGGSVIEFRDVTEEKRMERERLDALLMNEQQSIRIKESDIHKTNMTSFVSFVCHELRNPLQGVTSSAEFLNDTLQRIDAITSKIAKPTNDAPIQSTLDDTIKQLDLNSTSNVIVANTHRTGVPKARAAEPVYSSTLAELEGLLSYAKQLVNNIQTCAEHQALITNNVLDLSRLDAGKVEPVFDVVDVIALGHQSVSMLNSKAQRKAIRLSMSDAASEPVYLKADATLLSQVLLNLISNAIKFTPENGSIMIDMSSDAPNDKGRVVLHVSVTDTGLGMTEAEQQRLFQRFSQANRRVAQLYGGSGLGLSISKEIVRVMGGEMHVKSAHGKGSTFSFTSVHDIPTKQELDAFLRLSNSPPGGRANLHISNGTSTGISEAPRFRMVGVAEDNPINLKLLAKHLGVLGYEFILCTNGKEILDKFTAPDCVIDVVIMDMSMPVMDGLESASLMREFEVSRKASRTPIIALSGNALKEQVTDALSAGISDYLIKPCKQADLARVLQYWEHIVHTGAPHEPTFKSSRGG